jgi:hypothetical protein
MIVQEEEIAVVSEFVLIQPLQLWSLSARKKQLFTTLKTHYS